MSILVHLPIIFKKDCLEKEKKENILLVSKAEKFNNTLKTFKNLYYKGLYSMTIEQYFWYNIVSIKMLTLNFAGLPQSQES